MLRVDWHIIISHVITNEDSLRRGGNTIISSDPTASGFLVIVDRPSLIQRKDTLIHFSRINLSRINFCVS